MPTPASSFRLSTQSKKRLSRLAKERGKSMSEMLEIAVFHLDGTLRNQLPVYMNLSPDDEPRGHKRRQSAA